MAGRTSVVEVELPDGQVVLAEVASSGPADVALKDRLKLDEVGDALSSFCHWAFTSAQSKLPSAPGKVTVELGMKLTVKNGKLVGVIAEAAAEASLVLRLEW